MSEPVPYFTEDGEVRFGYRLTKEDLADGQMALEMYQASPDGRESYRAFRRTLPPSGPITISGYLEGDGASH